MKKFDLDLHQLFYKDRETGEMRPIGMYDREENRMHIDCGEAEMNKPFYDVLNEMLQGKVHVSEKTAIRIMFNSTDPKEADEICILTKGALQNILTKTAKMTVKKEMIEPNRVLKSGNRTIVFWEDGSKTVVKKSEDDEESQYAAFTAALGKKIFGCNSRIRSMLAKVTTYQEVKKK